MRQATLSFTNKGEIDPRTIRTMGVNVKEGPDAIGFFGTGLKYAIAVILRLDGEIVIYSGTDKYEFASKKVEIRGKDFEIITMNGDELGFTTEIGKTWEPWMAYREIYSNCLDEKGEYSIGAFPDEPKEGYTQIEIRGVEFEKVHTERHKYFLESTPVAEGSTCNIHSDPRGRVFYHGILVCEIESQFTYDLKGTIQLTEDRTPRYSHQITDAIRHMAVNCPDSDVVKSLLTQPQGTIEHNIDYHRTIAFVSETFTEVVTDLTATGNAFLNSSAKKEIKRRTKKSSPVIQHKMTELEQKQFDKAISFCAMLGFEVNEYPIMICKDLGLGIHGQAIGGTIRIDEECFKMGTKYLASTLIEEFIHLRKGFEDETRSMQNYLFETIVHLGERLQGDPI